MSRFHYDRIEALAKEIKYGNPVDAIKCWPTPANAANRSNAARKQAKRMIFCLKCDKTVLERHKCTPLS